MAFTSFKPTLFLETLILLARKNLVGAGFCNTSVAAELRVKGTKQTFNTLGDGSVADTDESSAMTYTEWDTSSSDLEITIECVGENRLVCAGMAPDLPAY